jgi:hypothetical protein
MIEHEIKLDLASGARLTILYFSDRALRWIFSYNYVGTKDPGAAPEVVNEVRLTADYDDGLLAAQILLSMHVVIPSRLGQEFFAGMDISPGAKTYLEFSYERIPTPMMVAFPTSPVRIEDITVVGAPHTRPRLEPPSSFPSGPPYAPPIARTDNVKISNDGSVRLADEYRLVEICKGARERVRVDGQGSALVQPIEFPFPVPDRIPVEFGVLHVPFRTNTGMVAHFDLPARTRR